MAWAWHDHDLKHKKQVLINLLLKACGKTNQISIFASVHVDHLKQQKYYIFKINKCFGYVPSISALSSQRHLRRIWFCITLQEEAHTLLVRPVRVEARHHHYLPRKVADKAGWAEHWFAQTAETFHHKAESGFWSPTGVWEKMVKKIWTG